MEWIRDPDLVDMGIAWLAICGIFAYSVYAAFKAKPKVPEYRYRQLTGEYGELKMAQRRAQLDALYADEIGDFMFRLLMENKISRQEYKRDCRRLGLKHKLPDLLSRNQHPASIRKRVLHAIKTMREANKDLNPKRIPGGSPTPSKKVFLVVGKRLERKS